MSDSGVTTLSLRLLKCTVSGDLPFLLWSKYALEGVSPLGGYKEDGVPNDDCLALKGVKRVPDDGVVPAIWLCTLEDMLLCQDSRLEDG